MHGKGTLHSLICCEFCCLTVFGKRCMVGEVCIGLKQPFYVHDC